MFPDRAADTGRLIPYETLLRCGLVHRVYLAELPDDPSASFGARLARLAILDATRTVEEARALLAQQEREPQRDLAIDLIETIPVYKFPNLSRDEIRIMLQLPETGLKKTRFYQEVFREGREEGREEGHHEGRREGEILILTRLLRLKFGDIPEEIRHRIEQAEADALLTWSERILTAERIEDVIV